MVILENFYNFTNIIIYNFYYFIFYYFYFILFYFIFNYILNISIQIQIHLI